MVSMVYALIRNLVRPTLYALAFMAIRELIVKHVNVFFEFNFNKSKLKLMNVIL